MQQIGNRIYFLRKQLNLSQRAFGEKIGIKKASMSSIEKNKSNPSTQTIKLICIEFNVSYDWLVDGVGDIFIENNDSIELLKNDYDLEDNEIKAIKAFLNLNKVESKVLVYYLEKAFGKDGQ